MNQSDTILLKRLIWIYFWLLVFEGTLRKWVLPGMSGPLLIVRDPIALAIIALAIKSEFKFPWLFSVCYWPLLLLFSLVGMIQILVTSGNTVPVLIFGMRTYFLHLPLIPIIAGTFDLHDVRRASRWLLIIAVPMALLMTLQFQASPDAWINRGAGADSGQIESAMGHIRAAGTFSFISGPIMFYSLVLALLIEYMLRTGVWKSWLAIIAYGSVVMATAVSGSRSMLVSLLIVVAAFGVGLLLRPQLAGHLIKLVVLGAIAFALIGASQVFQDGLETFGARVQNAADTESGTGGSAVGGLFYRAFGDYIEPFYFLHEVPLTGNGIGMGTNAGAAMLTGSSDFLLAESEWSRVVLEAGPFAGFLFLAFRVGIVFWMGRTSVRAARHGNLMPLLLSGAGAVLVLDGQWGQPTALGFSVLIAGFSLAAARIPLSSGSAMPPTESDALWNARRSPAARAPSFRPGQS